MQAQFPIKVGFKILQFHLISNPQCRAVHFKGNKLAYTKKYANLCTQRYIKALGG